MEAADLVRVKCGGCSWKGSRKESESHRCTNKDTQSELDKYREKTDEEIIQEINRADHHSDRNPGSTIETVLGIPL